MIADHVSTRKRRKSFALRVIPTQQWSGQEPVQLVTMMHSLVLDQRHPVAVEMVGTASQRSFLVRATSQNALDHVATQIQARYPQVQLQPLLLEDDPGVMRPGEAVSAIELKAGAAPYLPLQPWDGELSAGSDPVLGLLAALDGVPSGMRVVSQLALVPAPPNWSRRSQRKVVEHPLEPEYQRQRQQWMQRDGSRGPSVPMLLAGLVCFLLVWQFHQMVAVVWSWGGRFGVQQWMVHGVSPGTVGWGLGVIGGLGIILDQIRRRLLRPVLYQQRLVEQQTSQMAYRARLRLYAIGPAPDHMTHQVPFWFLLRIQWEELCLDISAVVQTRLSGRMILLIREGIQVVVLWLYLFLVTTGQQVRDQVRVMFLVWRERQQRWSCLERVVAAYRQYHLAAGNYFVPRKLSSRQAERMVMGGRGLLWWMGWWSGVRWSRHLITTEVVASLWHLPLGGVLPELAQVDHRLSRTLPLPPALQLHDGLRPVMGFSEHAGHRWPFTFPRESLSRHLFIGGKSGEGKSTCLEHVASVAMEQGGLMVIDPHGDLVDHVLTLVPKHRCEDVVVIDLSDQEHVLGFNPLDASQGRGRDKAIADVLRTLAHIWASSWGSRMENAFEFALRTLFEANQVLVAQGKAEQQYTLLDVMLVLTDEAFCHRLLDQITDPFILRWWYLYYDPLNQVMQRERSDPVLSKVAKFESLLARRIIGQSCSTINLTHLIQEERIVLVKLAKGVVGEDVARLIGTTLVGMLQVALEEQGVLEEAQRKHVGILIDEFQVLQGVDWSVLAELRKYGAAFYLATQSLEYLRATDASLLAVLLANVKQYILFHLSAQDAETMHAEIGVEPEDIVHLESYMCYARVVSSGQKHPPFSLRIVPPSPGDEKQAQQIRLRCQQVYTVSAAVIDERLRASFLRGYAMQGMASANTVQQTASSRFDGRKELQVAAQDVSLSQKGSGTQVRQQHGYRGRKAQDKYEEQQNKS